MSQEQLVYELAEIVADLRCQREASDAVAVAMAAVFLSVLPPGVDLVTPMRKMLQETVVPARPDSTRIDGIEVLRLKTEQYVQDHVDQIEMLLRALREREEQ